MKYFIANLKAHQSLNEAKGWIEIFKQKVHSDQGFVDRIQRNEIKVIICPSHPLLFYFKTALSDLASISLGAQDVSSFDTGSFTGEVTAKNLQGLVEYVIVGHSERRMHQNEAEEQIEKKLE